MKAVVLGGTGLIGGHLLRVLGESPEYPSVLALVRQGSTPPELPGVECLQVDYDHLKASHEAASCDVAFCCLGTTTKKAGSQAAFRRVDHDYVLAGARWALAHGANTFAFVSSLGASSSSRVFYNRVKGEVEAALDQLEFQRLLVFRPSLLLGDRRETRWGERIGTAMALPIAPLMAGPLKRYRPIQAEGVARAMARAALDTDRQGRVVIENDAIFELGRE
jgi:uncharacterized protein YbjT (DUF2867 family)